MYYICDAKKLKIEKYGIHERRTMKNPKAKQTKSDAQEI